METDTLYHLHIPFQYVFISHCCQYITSLYIIYLSYGASDTILERKEAISLCFRKRIEPNSSLLLLLLAFIACRPKLRESDETLRRDITSSPRSESEDLSTRRGSPQSTPLSFTSLHFTRYLSFTSAQFYSKRPLHVKLTPGSPLNQEDDVSTHIDSANSQRDSSSRKLYNGWK